MTWYAWALVAVFGVSALATVMQIGEPRRPITPGVAAVILVCDGLMVWAVVALAGAA